MYFKVEPKSELHHKLDALFAKQEVAIEATKELVEEIKKSTGDDCTEYYASHEQFGSFSYLIFNDLAKVPTGWVRAKFNSHAFAPSHAKKFSKKNAPILAKIDAVPSLMYQEFADVVNYGMYTGEASGTGMALSRYPSVSPTTPYLVATADFVTAKDYTPAAGMIEIKASEYHAIKEVLAEERKKKSQAKKKCVK